MKLFSSSTFFAILALGWMGLITYTSSLRGKQLKIARVMYVMPHRTAHWAAGTNAPTGVWGVVDRQDYTNILDKPVHAFEFSVLLLLWWRSCAMAKRPAVRTRAVLLAAAVSMAFACFDEYHQSFTPGRQMRAGDLLADWTGVGIGAVMGAQWTSWRRRRAAKNKPPSTTEPRA